MSGLFNHWFEDNPEEPFEDRIKELKEALVKTEKDRDNYKKVCFFYSEEIYRFIANFRQDNLDPKQKDALEILRTIADDCINNEAYKDKLYHKYITKDYYTTPDGEKVKKANESNIEELYSSLEVSKDFDYDDNFGSGEVNK